MSTVNISLPQTQIEAIDAMVEKYQFANRSEFIRSLLRLASNKPALVNQAATYPFVAPQEKSVKKIMADFRKNKRYSQAFLKDLEDGLRKSDYFYE